MRRGRMSRRREGSGKNREREKGWKKDDRTMMIKIMRKEDGLKAGGRKREERKICKEIRRGKDGDDKKR